MTYRVLADLVVLAHTLFVVFVVVGGFMVWRWRWVAWLHVPCAVWGVMIEYQGWTCPLTPHENALRTRPGLQGYESGYVEHYVLPVLYPAGLTRPTQAMPGTLVLAATLIAYALVVLRLCRGC